MIIHGSANYMGEETNQLTVWQTKKKMKEIFLQVYIIVYIKIDDS
jgi:hypothetical protein